MAHVLSAPELVKVRTQGNASKKYLGIAQYNTVYTARVNQSFTTTDMITEIIYDTGSGTLANVKTDMVMYVGSAAGLHDLGMVRIRKAPSATVFYIGTVSNISWADNLFLTVVDDFQLMNKTVHILAGVSYMDVDVAYSDQYADFDPVPVMGSHNAGFLDETTGQIAFTMGASADTDAWVLGSSITSYLWECPSALSISDATIKNPVITFNSVGTHPVYLTVTAANGKTAFGVRYCLTYNLVNMPITDFEISNRSADYDKGGWSFEVQINSGVTSATVRDKALCILFSQNYIGQALGTRPAPITGAENVDCVGYIGAFNTTQDYQKGAVSFTVDGAQELLKKMPSYPMTLNFASSTSTIWEDMPLLTVTRMLWQYFHWRSTATKIMDIILPPDAKYMPSLTISDEDLYSQLRDMAWIRLFANIGVDAYGRLFCETDPQMVQLPSRNWPIVMRIEDQDWRAELETDADTENQKSITFSAGLYVNSSGGASTFFSMSPGHVANRFGESVSIMDELPLVNDQTESNDLCGLYAGWQNHLQYISLGFNANLRAIDLFPRQYFSINLLSADDPRGFGYDGNLIPRKISYEHNPKTGYESPAVDFECETFPEIAVNGDVPAETGIDDWDTSTPLDADFVDVPDFLDLDTPPTEENLNLPSTVVIASDDFGVLYSTNINNGDISKIVWQSMNSGLTPTDISFIEKIVVTPNGTIYVKTLNKVFAAIKTGGTFKQIASSTDFPGLGDIYDIAVNPLKSDEIAMIGGEAGGFNQQKIKLANYSGITTTASHTNGYHYRPVITFANNKWYVIGSDIFAVQILSFNNAGLSGVPTSVFAPTTGQDQFIVTAGSQDLVFFWNSSATDYKFTTDPVDTFTALSINVDQFARTPQSISPSPTGQYIMAADGTLSTPKVSTDSGASWTTTALAVGPRIWENCKDNNRWLFGSGANIKITLDRGATDINLIGNLLYIAPLINIVGIRFIK